MDREERRPEVIHTVIWTCVGTAAATALALYQPLVFLLVFALAVLGGGVPWIMSGSQSDREFATIVVLSTVLGELLGLAWLFLVGNTPLWGRV
jgi:hypothetical protein